jgi:hypothetical protein
MAKETKIDWKWVAGGVAAVGVGYALHRYLNPAETEDPHMWLEDVLGEKCIDWAKVHTGGGVRGVLLMPRALCAGTGWQRGAHLRVRRVKMCEGGGEVLHKRNVSHLLSQLTSYPSSSSSSFSSSLQQARNAESLGHIGTPTESPVHDKVSV